jgi:drug/metabolite transporter (DMT)-like permease
MDWLLLSLACAASLATADALTKRHLSDYRATETVVVRFSIPGLLLAPWLVLEPLPPVPPAFWAWVAVLLPLEVLAMVLYVRAIAASPLSLTLPYLALTPVLVTGTGYLVLGEQVSLAGVGGILLVVVGAWLLNLDHALRGGPWAWLAPFRAVLHEPGSRLMVAVAVLYALTSAMGKGAMQYATPTSFGAFYFVALGLATLVVFGVSGHVRPSVLWRRPRPHLLVGVMMAVMIVTHFMALDRVEVAYMIAVKRTSMLFGMLYGLLWFAEPRIPQRLAAATIMLAGVAVIAFA